VLALKPGQHSRPQTRRFHWFIGCARRDLKKWLWAPAAVLQKGNSLLNDGTSLQQARLPVPIRALNAVGRGLASVGYKPRLDASAMLRAAEKAGLDTDLLPDLARQGMFNRVASLNQDAHFSLFGTIGFDQQLRRCLFNALGIERIIQTHPEIRDQKVRNPIFVVGMPRTGTTLMQRLLSLHNGARFVRFWESYEPVPRPSEDEAASKARRMREAETALSRLHWVAPSLRAVHPMTVDAPEECFFLMRNYFLVPRWFDFANMESYWKWMDALDAAAAYELLKRQLQVLQWLEPREHWVLKCPLHLGYIDELMRVFPDARIVHMQREPTEVAASLASLMSILWNLTSDHFAPEEIGRWSLETAAHLHAKGLPAMERLGPSQLVRVGFTQLVQDHAGTAERIYEVLGYRRDPRLTDNIAAWSRNNTREKHGRHVYTLSQFGLTEDEVMRAFA